MELTLRVRAMGCGRFGTGSGFAINPTTLVTNRHVVDGAAEVQVNTWDGQSATASLTEVAYVNDLALVTVDEALPLAASVARHDPAPGDRLLVAGYPQGGAVRLQTASVLDYRDGSPVGSLGHVIRLDVRVQPGNSGGPVLDREGQVVGVVYAYEKATGHALAVPASTLRRVRDHRADLLEVTSCP